MSDSTPNKHIRNESAPPEERIIVENDTIGMRAERRSPAPLADERCVKCNARLGVILEQGRYPQHPHARRSAPLADGGKTVFDGYPLSRAEYVERIHEGGRGGYGIATHDVLMHHDAALRAALDKAKEALMKIRDGIDGEYIATQRGVAIAANALAELEGKNA